MTYGVRRFVIDELLLFDDYLRTQARSVSGAATDLTVDVGGLPPDAQAVVDGLRGLSGLLERAEQAFLSGARSLGETAADALGVNRRGLELMWNALKGNVFPPGDPGPLGLGPWYAGRAAFAVGAGLTIFKTRNGHRYWVKAPGAVRPGSPLMPGRGGAWPMFSGRPVPPHIQRLIDRTARGLTIAGSAFTAASAFSRRLNEGASVHEAAGGAAGETATAFACARGGAALGMRVPGLYTKAAATILGGVGGAVGCSPLGRAVGDLASDVADTAVDGYNDVTPWEGAVPGSVFGLD
ncbi:MAG: hypothetical protein ACRDT4_24865 [Micromonosporaceae bacterium]